MTATITDSDWRYLDELLDMLWESPLTEREFMEEDLGPWGRKVLRKWEGALSIPIISQNPDWLFPVPSRQHVLDYLKEYAE